MSIYVAMTIQMKSGGNWNNHGALQGYREGEQFSYDPANPNAGEMSPPDMIIMVKLGRAFFVTEDFTIQNDAHEVPESPFYWAEDKHGNRIFGTMAPSEAESRALALKEMAVAS